MTLKRYLNLMLVCTVICWLIWLIVFLFLKPANIDWPYFVLFYFSLFLAILGTASITGFIIYVRFSSRPIFEQVIISFRQSLWLAIILTAILILKFYNLLRWWNLIIFILFIVSLETLFIFSRRSRPASNNQPDQKNS
ncbi:MAG: hypothetical protein AAB465_00350 [Patescibacteria group bacterium]